MFLSDQGRDAIIVKNIATLKHFPAIGASSSVGQVYLGPFYYYLIAPFLLLFNFDPVGLAYGAAFLSVVGIILSYLIVAKEFDKLTAVFFLLLVSFSFVNIESSRFSWNPNLLPFLSFLTLYFFYQTTKTNKLIYAILLGAFFSFSTQLHYLAFFLFLPIVLTILTKQLSIVQLLNYLITFFSFLFFSLPLLIFDLRHQFLNTKNFLKLFSQQQIVSPQNNTVAIFLFFGLIIFLVFLKKIKQNNFVILNFLNILLFLLAFSFLSAPPHPHYFGPIYLSLFLIIAYILVSLKKLLKKIVWVIGIIIFFLFYIVANVKDYYFLYQKGGNQIAHSKKVAEFLAQKIDNKPFNIATWPVEFTEDNYVYFLELKGLMPADRKKIEITDQMFILCNKEPCQVTNSPSWNISMFGPAKIDKIWGVEGIKIYRLIHK